MGYRVMEQMGNEVWGTWAMGIQGPWVQKYGAQGAMGYRSMGHRGNEDTWAMGYRELWVQGYG